MTHVQFRIELATNLLTLAGEDTALTHGSPHGPLAHPLPSSARLTERHFPSTIGKTGGKSIQRDCTVCSQRKGRGRKTTVYKCKECDLPMCVVPCFELYHTKKDPARYLDSA